MTVHRPHPLTGLQRDGQAYDDHPDAVLYDNCDRCAEHAADPLSTLDPDNTALLWAQMVTVEKAPAFTGPGYRNATEARACRALYRVAVWAESTMPLINPWVFPWVVRTPGETAWVPLMSLPARDDAKDRR